LIYWPAIAIGRFARFAIRRVRPGGGSALPGLIVSKIAPGLLARTMRAFPKGLVVITGSAGKSTTTKMAVSILRAHGLKVFTNPSTANIAQGFFSTIVEQSDLSGKIAGDVAVLEMDEGHAAEITRSISPDFVTILNVLDDQLDRFIDPSSVRDKLLEVANRASIGLILNVDDQNIAWINERIDSASAAVRHYVDVIDQVKESTPHGLGYSNTYLDAIPVPETTSAIVSLSGRDCEVLLDGEPLSLTLPSRGLHFALDALAALQTAKAFLGQSFNTELAVQTLNEMPPVFARGEMVQIDGQLVEFILVQNPTSFQLNLDALPQAPERLMIAIGRDVHDPSWLWTVDYSKLQRVDVVSGFNASEMALCLRYNNIACAGVTDDLRIAFDQFLALPSPQSGVKTVLFSADAMRRSRRMLGFTSPEDVERS
jgi:UDP-N-acetylmuramyl tripeptide synthase